MSFQDIAAAALERGFSIIPLVPRAKDPLPGWGPTKKTRTVPKFPFPPADARLVGVHTEDCNVGIVADENFLILETDDESQLRQLVRNCTGRELPITLTSQARSGRPHFYYRQTPRSLEVGNCTVAGLFEMRAKNQYVVGPGSVHPSGAVYQITADYEVLPMPGWLVDCLLYLKGAASTVPAGQRVEVPLSGKVGEGEGRHYLLTSWAGRLWDGKKTEEELFEEVWAINVQSCEPPRDGPHVMDIVRWVMQNGTPHDPGPKVTFGSTEVWGKTSTDLLNREIPAREVLLKQGRHPFYMKPALIKSSLPAAWVKPISLSDLPAHLQPEKIASVIALRRPLTSSMLTVRCPSCSCKSAYAFSLETCRVFGTSTLKIYLVAESRRSPSKTERAKRPSSKPSKSTKSKS
jgi:hypothetical protein